MRMAVSCCALAAASLASATRAETPEAPPAPTPGTAERVVVTATGRSTPVQDLPATAVVLDGALAEQASAFSSAEEIVQLVPGLQVAVANGTQAAFQIRGVGAVDHQALTPSGSAVFLDGAFLATNVQTGAMLYDLDSIEVLKGPPGARYGRNASSGAISFLTRKPGAGSYADLSVGNFGRFDVRAAQDIGLGDDTALRIAGRYLQQGPTLDNIVVYPDLPAGPDKAAGERKEGGLRATLSTRTPGGGEYLFRAHVELDRGVNPAPRNDSLGLSGHDISIGPDGVRDTDTEFYGTSFEARLPVGGFDLVSLTAFEGYNQQYGFDFDGTQGYADNPGLNANLSYDRDYAQISHDMTVSRDLEHGRISFGGSAAFERFDQLYAIWCGVLDPRTWVGTCNYVGAAGRVGPVPASTTPAASLLTDITQSRRVAALFGEYEVQASERLALSLGLRVTNDHADGHGSGRHVYRDGTIAFNNRGGVGPAVGENTLDDTRLTGKASASYRVADGQMLYASLASGFKSGGFNGEVANDATHYSDAGLFDAETVTAAEIGYKASLGDTLEASLAAFWQDYDSPQARIFVSFVLPDDSVITSNSLSNLDAATSKGLEASLTWRPLDGLDLDAGLTLLDTEIRQDASAGGGANADLFDGNPLPFASKLSATLAARYAHPIGGGRVLKTSLSAKTQSGFYLDAEGRADRRQDGYTLLDASLGLSFADDAFEIGVWGRNLLDEDYALSGYGFLGYNTFRSDPASWGVALKRRW
ncbi:MAG: TonB-dependent receptor [Hyphomonadaceae bacterium]